MPREIYVVSRQPLTFEVLLEAAARVDGSLVPRMINSGVLTQLVDTDDVAVLTLDNSRLLSRTTDVERIIGPLPTTGEVWWTEATAPWGRAGVVGVRIARAIGDLLGARVQVEEGQ